MDEKIKKYREQLDMTHQEMADYLGISRVNYTQKENSQRKWSDSDKMKLKDLVKQRIDPKITIDDLFY